MTKKDSSLLHKEAAAFFHDKTGISGLMEALQYSFHDTGLLKTALTHPAASQVKNNQRLEFLGDAVLELIISHALFELKNDQEGKLTFRRQKLVNEQTLAGIAREIGLGEHLILDASLNAQGGRDNPSILADAMEAVLAAIYLDGGLEKVRHTVLRLWEQAIKSADAELDPKGRLQTLFQASGLNEPEYKDILAEGPAHRRVFTVAVFKDGVELARGTGATKRLAQQQAAQKAILDMERGKGT